MRTPRALILLAGAAIALVGPAAAEWTEERPVDLSRFSLEEIAFTQDTAVPEGALRDVIKSTTSGLLSLRPVKVEQIEGDVIRIRNHLRREGYWNASVGRRLFFDRERRRVRVMFDVDAGPRREVGKISVLGNRTFSEEEVLSWKQLETGDPFDIGRADRDRTRIENTYANRGFYEVRIVADIQPSAEEASPIVHDLIFRVEEGTRFFVGKVTVEGHRLTRESIIRRELTVDSGDVLSREALAASRARLYGTGYFEQVSLVPTDPDPEKGTVDLVIRVVERKKMRFVGTGVGYGTRDQLRLSAEWGHRNLWGRGKRATLRGLLATELFPVDLVRGRIEARYVESWLFNTRTQGTLELFYERSREFFRVLEPQILEGEYDLDLVGLGLNVNRQLSRFTRSWVALRNEWADIDARNVPPPDEETPDVTRSVSLTLERDRRDDYFEARKGFLNRVFGRVSGGILGGDNNFWKASVESSWFRKLEQMTLAGRVRVGYERPFGTSTTILDRDRFKIGGAASVRGYREQEIVGDFLILTNLELRFPIFWLLDGGVFVDGGNAWQEPEDVSLTDFRLTGSKSDPALAAQTEFRYAVGGGLRLGTPVGPIRLDYGHKLKILPVPVNEPEEARWRVHLSLGHVF